MRQLFFIVRALVPSLLVFAALCAIAECWYYCDPSLRINSVDDAVLDVQWKRARRPIHADLVILGDSSALMDVNARQLDDHLDGVSVESLALFGSAGPRAYAKIAETALQRGAQMGTVVILLAPHTLMHEESYFAKRGIETRILNVESTVQRSPGMGARNKVYHDLIGQVIQWPVPGWYGVRYGTREDIENLIVHDQGTLFDPHPPITSRGALAAVDYEFTISDAVARRLPPLRELVADLDAREIPVFVGVTPIPLAYAGEHTAASRRRLIDQLAAALDVEKSDFLALPMTFPNDRFANVHLTDQGRQEYTQLVAAQLMGAGVQADAANRRADAARRDAVRRDGAQRRSRLSND